MDKLRCHTCGQPAQLICFCRKTTLCEHCVGRHLMDEPSLTHKPCTLWSEEAKVYEEHLQVLKVKEDLFLAEARKKQELGQLARRKVGEGVSKLRALKPVIVDYVALALEVVTKQLPALAEKLSQEMMAVSDSREEVLIAAMQHFEGTQKCPENEIVQLLESVKTPSEMAALDLVLCKLDLGDINVEEVLRTGLQFSLSLLKKPSSKDKSSASPLGPKQPAKTMLPKPSTPAKKPTKAESKKAGAPKAQHSLNQSQDTRQSDDRADFSSLRLSKKLSDLKAEQQKAVRPEPTKDTNSGKFDPFSEDECDLLKGESPSPDPPLQRQPLNAQTNGLKRLSTLVEDSGSDKRFTRLQVVRTSNRQSSLKDTERKLQALEEQWKSGREWVQTCFPD